MKLDGLVEVQCAKRNILVEDVAVEHNQIGDMDMDRPGMKSVVNAIANRDYEVLVLRNQYDVTEDDSDWEQFLSDMADMEVQVYLADVGEFVGTARLHDLRGNSGISSNQCGGCKKGVAFSCTGGRAGDSWTGRTE